MTEDDGAEDPRGDYSLDVDRDEDAADDDARGVADADGASGDEPAADSTSGGGVAEADPEPGSADPEPGSADPESGSTDPEPGSAGAGEPLGSLRDRVVDDDDEPAVAFPEGVGGEDGGTEDGDGPSADDGGRTGDEIGDVGGDRQGPLGDLAAGVDERRRRRDDADDELFESMDVGEVDADALWEQVEAEEPSVATPESRAIREVRKRKYCAGCPHFSRPPEVRCEHDGTDILEQVDMETFKVADCPIVLEDERLEDATTD